MMDFGRFIYKTVTYMLMGAVTGAAVGVAVAIEELRKG